MINFIKNTYKNIEWILVIDSNKPWKNIWILALTHGDETVWLDVFKYLINDFDLENKIISGKIFLICVNLKAYEENKRFCDINMNRISNKPKNTNSYESNRFEELKEVFEEIDIVLDLHSVSKSDDIIWIIDEKTIKIAKEFIDAEFILVDYMSKTWALIWEFCRNNKLWFWLECGNHTSLEARTNWVRNTLNFLSYFNAIDLKIKKSLNLKNILAFDSEISVKNSDFRFEKDYVSFCKIAQNETYAFENQEYLKNETWENLYIWLVSKYPKVWDGAWFLFREI